MLRKKNPRNFRDAQEKDKRMDKHVSSIGKFDLLGTSSSRSHPIRREDKAKISNVTDQTVDPIASLNAVMQQLMKCQSSYAQDMVDLTESHIPPYDNQIQYNHTQGGKFSNQGRTSTSYQNKMNNLTSEDNS